MWQIPPSLRVGSAPHHVQISIVGQLPGRGFRSYSLRRYDSGVGRAWQQLHFLQLKWVFPSCEHPSFTTLHVSVMPWRHIYCCAPQTHVFFFSLTFIQIQFQYPGPKATAPQVEEGLCLVLSPWRWLGGRAGL